jgi:hypothetical protein
MTGIPNSDDIWKDDLLDRRQYALALEAYISSLARRPSPGDNSHGTAIALDSPYGLGKTFFLRRLSRQLTDKFAVAYVDAWQEDAGQDPFLPIVAAIEGALAPTEQDGQRIRDFLEKAGTAFAAIGAAATKGVASAVLTAGVVSAVEQAFGSLGVEDRSLLTTTTTQSKILKGQNSSGKDFLKSRLTDYHNAKNSIKDFKDALSALLNKETNDNARPIVIIIDELDRCRPTFAIELLERAKHIFDVPGLVLVFGTHLQALQNSISAVYGAKFDGPSYLRRFFSRTLTLPEPTQSQLYAHLFKQSGIDLQRFHMLGLEPRGPDETQLGLPELIAHLAELNGASLRDAPKVVERLEMALALSEGQLLAPYIIPMIVADVTAQGTDPSRTNLPVNTNYNYRIINGLSSAEVVTMGEMAAIIHAVVRSPFDRSYNRESPGSVFRRTIHKMTHDPSAGQLSLAKYEDLVRSVGAFHKAPSQDG